VDVTGDGKADLLWEDPATGELAVWILDGTTVVGSAPLTPGLVPTPDWLLVAPR